MDPALYTYLHWAAARNTMVTGPRTGLSEPTKYLASNLLKS